MEQASTQKPTLQDYAPKHYIELSELEENFDCWMEVVEKKCDCYHKRWRA